MLVLNNRDLNQVTWEQRAMSGDPEVRGLAGPAGLPVRELRRAARAEGHPRGVARTGSRSAWDEALSADRPVVYEAITDPEVPPLPPHITIEQAKALSSALLSGDPNAGRIVKQSFQQKVQEFLPGR